MGCAVSAPQHVDRLPIRAHCRTAFSRCSATERVNGDTSEKSIQNQTEQGHDVVLCYPLGGTVFGLELQARFEKMESASLWTLDHFLSVPGTPIGISKSMSGGSRNSGSAKPALEIKPAPEAAAAAMTSSAALSREIRMCRRGVVVLSCPLPALEEWAQDVRPLIAASGPPIKYLSQHSTEALHEVEHRMLMAAEALASAKAAATAAVSKQQAHPEAKKPASQPQTPPPSAAAEGRNGSCLDGAMWALPVPSRPPLLSPQQQQQTVQSISQPVGAAVAISVAAPSLDASSCSARVPSPSPFSLMALQASDSDICRRVSQLLGPWTCAGTAGTGVAGCSTTPVETLVVSPPPACSGTTAERTALHQQLRSPPGSAVRQQQHQRHPSCQWQETSGSAPEPGCTTEDGGPGAATGCVSETRCVLRYRDQGWATPVAFVCAQLENELGRANVCVQVATPASAVTSTLSLRRQASPGLATGSAVRLSSQSVGGGSNKCRQQQRTAFGTVVAAVATVQGSERSTGDGSRCCSGSPSCGQRTEVVSESTSSGTSGRTTPPIARTDDDLEPFTSPSVYDCTTPLPEAAMATGSSSSNERWPIGEVGNGSAAPPDLRPRDEDPEQRQPQGTSEHGGDGGAGAAACLVYFVTPGLLAPLRCLADVGEGLAQGRRILIVVHGECSQRLQDYAPAGMTPEAWKSIRRLWHQRLIYVPDYHIPFCALLKQGITDDHRATPPT
ncbi:hypothetical protein VOLCADRAFT_121010 [Volvox carteri f. nagariensis]|uniref:Uncharacterized protein n=1 Tax=Volvox carteri f. nagariensis TaxID=3068 RepID=D8TZE4_VOLCA|nr:uncharacterized protein VOLCADRAFT_121010 [Volvox carteri f. nagariensis]EFJ47167.1 hypothetical protein VOLCADRAFT_121010 [Volvox carteri f. nagariensis]|eukprot:XP_002951716.1 hypothetical protein VOLCADRAFT_121010 [Volvox carteri f. nagariensis]